MRDPIGFMINTTKLLVLNKSSGEERGGLLNCTKYAYKYVYGYGGTTILEKLGHDISEIRLLINYLIFIFTYNLNIFRQNLCLF